MHERVPKWLEQVTSGLGDGKDWIVRKWKDLSVLPRFGLWLCFQAVMAKVQLWLWHSLLDVVDLAVRLLVLPLHVQLLLIVIAFLTAQTFLTESRFNRTWEIVENMDESHGRKSTVTDGGSKNELKVESYKRSSWRVYVICCAILGGIVGVALGPTWVIGLTVLGAMVGDEWARRTLAD